MAEELPQIALKEKLKGLQEWRSRVLSRQPNAYSECPCYMKIIDKQIAEAKEQLGV